MNVFCPLIFVRIFRVFFLENSWILFKKILDMFLGGNFIIVFAKIFRRYPICYQNTPFSITKEDLLMNDFVRDFVWENLFLKG